MTAYDRLATRFARIATIGEASSVLGWDAATMMPPGGGAARGDQLAVLAGISHSLLVAPVVGDDLAAAEGAAEACGAAGTGGIARGAGGAVEAGAVARAGGTAEAAGAVGTGGIARGGGTAEAGAAARANGAVETGGAAPTGGAVETGAVARAGGAVETGGEARGGSAAGGLATTVCKCPATGFVSNGTTDTVDFSGALSGDACVSDFARKFAITRKSSVSAVAVRAPG